MKSRSPKLSGAMFAALSLLISGACLSAPPSQAASKSGPGPVSKASSKPVPKPASYDDSLESRVAAQSAKKNISQDPVTKAKAILREIESIEHPENRIQVGSAGWQDERAAAAESSRHRLQSCQSRLSALGVTVAPVLAANLDSTNRDVSQTCTTVLGQFGEAAVPCLIDMVKKSGPTTNAVAALRQIGNDALPAVMELLQSSDQGKSLTAITVLNSFLPGNSLTRHRHYAHFESSFMPVRSTNNDVVLPISAVNQLCLLATKDKSVKYKEQLIELLGKVGPRAPIVADTLISFTNDDQPVVREMALRALSSVVLQQDQTALHKTVQVFITSLKNDDYAQCRAEAALALGRIPTAADEAVPPLVAALKDGYDEVSAAAIESLGAFGDKSAAALPALIKCIQDSPDSPIAFNAMRAIGHMKTSCVPALPVIVSGIQSSNTQMQSAAISAVDGLGAAASVAVKPLMVVLASGDQSIRYSVIRALGAIGPQAKDAVPALREIARSTTNERMLARQSLQKITGSADDKDNNDASGVGVMPGASQSSPIPFLSPSPSSPSPSPSPDQTQGSPPIPRTPSASI